MASPIEYAKLAVQIMDQSKPGWADLIDLSKFDMHEVENCIIGQCYPEVDYDEAFDLLEHDGPENINHLFNPWIWPSEKDQRQYLDTIDNAIYSRRSKK